MEVPGVVRERLAGETGRKTTTGLWRGGEAVYIFIYLFFGVQSSSGYILDS